MKKTRFIVAVGLCLASASAFAQPAVLGISGTYVTVDGGLSLVPDQDLQSGGQGLRESYGTGGMFGGGLGFENGGNWRSEIDAQWSHSPMHGPGISGYTNGTSLMANELYDFTTVSTLTPYVGAGIGSVDITDKVNGTKDDDWQPGYQLRGGLKYPLSDQLTGHVEDRWQQAENGKFDLASGDIKQPYKNNAVLLGIDYAF